MSRSKLGRRRWLEMLPSVTVAGNQEKTNG
jgi:hypothetical protein